MAKKKYLVDLTAEERHTLEQLLQKGKSNAARATINWQFTTADARVKLHHLYPSISL
jgi:hypothetical protein